MALKFDPRAAQEYLRRLTARQNESPGLEKTIIQAERFAARPTRVRGLTTMNVYSATVIAPFDVLLVAPPNPARRLLILCAATPMKFLPTNLLNQTDLKGWLNTASVPMVFDDDKFGVLVQLDWYAIEGGVADTITVVEEVYL